MRLLPVSPVLILYLFSPQGTPPWKARKVSRPPALSSSKATLCFQGREKNICQIDLLSCDKLRYSRTCFLVPLLLSKERPVDRPGTRSWPLRHSHFLFFVWLPLCKVKARHTGTSQFWHVQINCVPLLLSIFIMANTNRGRRCPWN